MGEDELLDCLRGIMREIGMEEEFYIAKNVADKMTEINQQILVVLATSKALLDAWAPDKQGPNGQLPEAYASETFLKLSKIIAVHSVFINKGMNDLKDLIPEDKRKAFGFDMEE